MQQKTMGSKGAYLMPTDIHADSDSRLPLVDRETLDEVGKQAYDRAANGGNIAGLKGPGGIGLYSTKNLRGAQPSLPVPAVSGRL